MEHFLEDQRVLKQEVYELFRQHPELLVAEEEGMTKGGLCYAAAARGCRACTGCALWWR